ncbi:MAG: DnaJ C-terminal domain-containing protein [Pirellulaceae bacterium]
MMEPNNRQTPTMEDDYYKILELSRGASEAEIQKAYRTLARKYHPDVNPDDRSAKKKFQQIQKAYDVLKDSKKREMYDRYGSAFESMGEGGPGADTWRTHAGGPQGFEDIDISQIFGGARFGGPGVEPQFGDIFSQFGGGVGGRPRRGPRRAARGADLRHELRVPFNTAVTGGEARLKVRRPSGQTEEISVKIPAGIEDGKTIRLRDQGERDPAGGAPGDILIQVRVAPHPCFRRRGKDLEVDVPVSLAEAALGAKIDVPTPKGVITLTLPPATSSGKRLRVRGHGVQAQGGTAGDLYAEIHIVLPTAIDETSQDLVRQLDQRLKQNPRTGLRW